MISLVRAAALFCAAASLFALAVPNARAADAAPVTIKSCDYSSKYRAVEVQFHNASDKTVSAVDLLVMSASGPFLAFEHKGEFAPGSDTMRRSVIDEERFYAQVTERCVVSTVTFGDGTTWQNPAVGADLEHTLVQTPGSPIRMRDCRVMDFETGYPVWHYTFVDRADQPATNVTIGLVEDGAMVDKKVHVGTFSPGIEIVQEDIADHGIVGNDVLMQRCVVLSATLADGTTWNNPSPPPSSAWPPIDASADSSGGQITITGCDSSKAHYRNDGPLQTTAVDIALLEDGQIVRSLRDVHNLSADDELTSRFRSQNTTIKIKNEKCVPLRVDYANGTQWVNPALKG